LIEHAEDQILMIDLGPVDGRAANCVDAIGRRGLPPERTVGQQLVDAQPSGRHSGCITVVDEFMASITLKNLSDDLMSALRNAAAQDRRSLTQEIIHLLDDALRLRSEAAPQPTPDVKAQLAAWRKLAGTWESDVDPAVEADAVMQARTRGREVDF
jgi:plasmid stability protein